MRSRFWILILALLASAPVLGQVEFFDEAFDYDRDHPAAGQWVGNIQVGEQWWYGMFHIERGDEDKWTVRATITSAALVALGVECTDVEITNGHVAFTVTGQIGGVGRFSGDIREDGQRMTGTITHRRPVGDPVEGELELARTVAVMDLPDPMAFTGKVQVQGVMELGMTFAFARTPQGNWVGHVDVPAQMTHGFVLAEVKREDQTFTAVMPGPMPAHIKVQLDETGRRLTGSMKQGPFDLAIDFARHDGYVGAGFNRPQHPKPPYPYDVREVTVEHPDGHTLAGTLTVPEGDGPFPAVALITGSGPQDRDETLLGHKPFLVIADYLTRHGIAVLRCDDRGTGGSTGKFSGATTEVFATDALAAVNFLKTVEDVDPKRIGLIGHSEGAMIAPIVAGMSDDVAFLVLLAAPSVPGSELLEVQGELILKASGADEETVADLRERQARVFELIREGASTEELRDAVRPMLEAQLAAATGLEGEQVEEMVEAQLAQVTSAWMRFFITYDPRPALAKLKCPVLALNGTLDLQVWHEQNLDMVEKTITEAGGDVTAKRYEGLNHLFQPATTGSVMEYAAIETTFDEAVLNDIVAWIEKKVTGDG